jgi:hypothetical protein
MKRISLPERRRFKGFGANSYDQECYGGLPPDLYEKQVYVGEKQPGSSDRITPPPNLGEAVYLSRGFQGRSILIGTTATLIERATSARGYLVLNPSRSAGLTNSFLIASGAGIVAAGNTQATPVGVANFLNLHLHLIVTVEAGGASWDFIMQTRDPITGLWADVQTVFAAVIPPAANYYAYVGNMGVAVDMAFRWNPVLAGAISFSLSGTLKDGVIGSSAGLAQTVFIGGNEGVSVVSGYPVLEGQEKPFIIGDNVELWGIANTPTTINIFEL